MPIRPENRDRYPADWPALSLSIRDGRAGWQCECHGECATRGYGRRACLSEDEAEAGYNGREGTAPWPRCQARQGYPSRTGARVVLTVAHLDDTPENCDPENLRAFCQACHLAYDTRLHRANREASARGDLIPLFAAGETP
jgi:hypothetical protein